MLTWKIADMVQPKLQLEFISEAEEALINAELINLKESPIPKNKKKVRSLFTIK